jgi:5-methylcytosine-specific restriction endonuclease McrBC regulatory subunit McrC
VPKGKLLLSQLARRPIGTRIEAPCRYTHRTPDVPLNRLVLAALQALRPAVLDRRLRFELHAREALFREICELAPLSYPVLQEARASMDRRSAYYEPVLRLAELVLESAGPTFVDGRTERLPGFLFNMDRLFERFVARLWREHVPPGLRVQSQESLRTAYRYRVNPHRRQPPELRPDIVVRDARDRPVLILDTKYKLLADKSLAPADLYQLTLYSLSFGREAHVPARIVYPSHGPAGTEPVLDFLGFQHAHVLGSVSMYGLDLRECAEALRRGSRTMLDGIVMDMLAAPA